MERDIQFKFSMVMGNMTWDDMGRKKCDAGNWLRDKSIYRLWT